MTLLEEAGMLTWRLCRVSLRFLLFQGAAWKGKRNVVWTTLQWPSLELRVLFAVGTGMSLGTGQRAPALGKSHVALHVTSRVCIPTCACVCAQAQTLWVLGMRVKDDV